MNFGQIIIPQTAGSTFARQVARDAALLGAQPIRSVCNAIAMLAAANDQAHGGRAIAQTSAAAPEWNAWAQSNGCVLPYPSRPVQSHRDIAVVDAAVKQAMAAAPPAQTGNVPRQGQLPGQQGHPGVTAVLPRQTMGPQTPEQLPGNDDGGTDWEGWARALWKLLKGYARGAGWTYGQMTNTDRLRASGKQAIAPLRPAALSALRRVAAIEGGNTSKVPEWAYYDDAWRLDITGPGLLGAPDFTIPALSVVTTGCLGQGCPGSGNGTTTGGTGSTAGVEELLGPGEDPQMVTVRRCRGGKRLAINGKCYPKELLTGTKLRMNNPKKAIVPHSAGARIRKAKSDINKIQTYASKDLYGGHTHSHEHRHTHTRRRSHHHRR